MEFILDLTRYDKATDVTDMVREVAEAQRLVMFNKLKVRVNKKLYDGLMVNYWDTNPPITFLGLPFEIEEK